MSTIPSANQRHSPLPGIVAAANSTAWTSPSAKPVEQGAADDAGAAAQARSSLITSSKAELDSRLQELQAKMERRNPALGFVLDESSGRALIQVTDRNTKEVIQQFPAEAALQFSKELDRLDKGHLVHKMA